MREALGVECLGRRPPLRVKGTAEGATVGQASSAGVRGLPPPSHGRWQDALRPACPIWIAKRVPGAAMRRAGSRTPRCKRRLVGIRVEAEAAVRDAPVALHRRRLDHHHAPGARDGELHQVLQVPIRGAAVFCAEYWHMGETTMRLARVSSRRDKGENKAQLIEGLLIRREGRIGDQPSFLPER